MKTLLFLLILLLLLGYVGYRVLRFLTRVAQTVAGIHEAGQRRSGNVYGGPRPDPETGSGRDSGGNPPWNDRRGGPGAEKDITARSRIIEEKPGPDG